MFPERGDSKSPPIIALAMSSYLAFWLFAVWAPIALVAAMVIFGRAVLPTAAACLACGVAALFAAALGRAIFSGHRIAYLIVCLAMLAGAALHIMIALSTSSATAVLAASRAVAYLCLALFAMILTVRRRASSE